MFYVYNTMNVDGRTYRFGDQTRVEMPSAYGLDDSFYGGRLHWIGKTDTDVLLLIEKVGDSYRVIDTGSTTLTHTPVAILRTMCKTRKIAYLEKDEGDKKATTHREFEKLLA